MNTLMTFIIVCPMVFIAGFIDAIAGGGGLISLPTYLITGLPVHTAIATNKMSSSMGTAVATYRYGKSGFIPVKQSLVCAVFALVGSSMGAKIALAIDDGVFKIIMLVILPLTAIYTLRSKNLDKSREEYSIAKTIALAVPIALIIGMYDGFYGPGTGTFLLLMLTGVAHMSLKEAAGATKVINLTTNITALMVFLVNGKVYLPLGITAGIFSIAGNYMGAKMFADKGAKSVKPLIIVVLTIFFIKVLIEVVGG